MDDVALRRRTVSVTCKSIAHDLGVLKRPIFLNRADIDVECPLGSCGPDGYGVGVAQGEAFLQSTPLRRLLHGVFQVNLGVQEPFHGGRTLHESTKQTNALVHVVPVSKHVFFL